MKITTDQYKYRYKYPQLNTSMLNLVIYTQGLQLQPGILYPKNEMYV